MEDKLIQQLKTLRGIYPDRDFSAKSRGAVLSERRKFRETKSELHGLALFAKRQLILSLAGSAVLIAGLVFGISYFGQIFTRSNAVARANQINDSIQVKLDEIRYFIENETPIDVQTAIRLNVLLSEAKKNLEQAASSLKEQEVNEFLTKIRSSQEILMKMNDDLNGK